MVDSGRALTGIVGNLPNFLLTKYIDMHRWCAFTAALSFTASSIGAMSVRDLMYDPLGCVYSHIAAMLNNFHGVFEEDSSSADCSPF